MLNTMQEEWKVCDTNPKFEVSNHGNFRCGKIPIKPVRVGRYSRIQQYGLNEYVHILVADTWIPKLNTLRSCGVRHIDKDTYNNSVANLERYIKNYKGSKPGETTTITTGSWEEKLDNISVHSIDHQTIHTQSVNKYSIVQIPETGQWSVFYTENGKARYVGVFDSLRDVEAAIQQ